MTDTNLFASVDKFISSIDAAKTHSDVFAALHARTLKMGFAAFAYELIRSPKGATSPFYFSSYPKKWVEHYIKQRYSSHDMVSRHAAQTIRPFLWEEATQRLPKGSIAERIMNEAMDVNLKAGANVPLNGPGATKAYFAVANDMSEEEFSKLFLELRHELHLVALYAHERILELGIPKVVETPPKFKAREIEILNLSANGKSSWEISKVLSLSESTVNEYIQAICRKFDVNGRTHATAIAVSRGIIAPY